MSSTYSLFGNPCDYDGERVDHDLAIMAGREPRTTTATIPSRVRGVLRRHARVSEALRPRFNGML